KREAGAVALDAVGAAGPGGAAPPRPGSRPLRADPGAVGAAAEREDALGPGSSDGAHGRGPVPPAGDDADAAPAVGAGPSERVDADAAGVALGMAADGGEARSEARPSCVRGGGWLLWRV